MTVFCNNTDTGTYHGLFVHHEFKKYLKFDEEDVRKLLNVVALRGVAQAATLTAIGVKVIRLRMPTMSHASCCAVFFSDDSWINNPRMFADPRTCDSLYVEQICWSISGAVAEYSFGESDYFGELGLRDLEGVYEHIKVHISGHRGRHFRLIVDGISD